MLKKVMAVIKVRMRAIETYLMIQSLLLRDKKMVRHLFQQRKCFKLEDEDPQPDNSEAVISNSIATTPASMVQVAEDTMYDDVEEVHPVSVIEMVKNAQEGQGKEFILEDDIDKVADMFIQRFHHQIWLQKQQSEEGIHT